MLLNNKRAAEIVVCVWLEGGWVFEEKNIGIFIFNFIYLFLFFFIFFYKHLYPFLSEESAMRGRVRGEGDRRGNDWAFVTEVAGDFLFFGSSFISSFFSAIVLEDN